MEVAEIETVAVCRVCGKERPSKSAKGGGVKLPVGWKRRQHDIYCRQCWCKAHVLRALVLPVAEPISGTWRELDADLKVMWALTTRAANWMMTQCYLRDIRRSGEDRMPSMPRVYLYPEARLLFPDLPSQSIASLEQAIQRKYRRRRYDIIWTSAASLPNMHYPQPFPVHNQGWCVELNEQNQPVLSVRVGARRWDLRLKGGARYCRQIAGIRRMVEKGELAIYRAHDGAILCKLVGWLERTPISIGNGTLIVRTCKDRLLVALDVKENRVWSENCDHLPRLIAQYRNRLQRLAEDEKAEQRPVAPLNKRREELKRKHSARMKTTVQEIALHLANFAQRRRFASVLYSDCERWLDQFPYFALEERLRFNLDERGIAFVKSAAGSPAEQCRESLEQE